MSTKTTNLEMTLLAEEDNFDTNVYNENFQKTDDKIGELNSMLGSEELTTTSQTHSGAINELNKKTVGKVIPKSNVTTTYNNNRIMKINNVVFCNISLTTLKEIYVTEHIADIPTEFKMSNEFGSGINVPLYDVDCKKVGNLWVSVSGAISYYSDTGTGSIPKSKNIYANFSYMT